MCYILLAHEMNCLLFYIVMFYIIKLNRYCLLFIVVIQFMNDVCITFVYMNCPFGISSLACQYISKDHLYCHIREMEFYTQFSFRKK